MTEELLSATPAPLSPTTESERLLWLRLLRSRRVGVATFHRLLQQHRSAAAALEALPEIARAAGVANYHPCQPDIAEREIAAAKAANATMLTFGAPDYPSMLGSIVDAPPILWATGNIALAQQPKIALVGARNASSLGTRMAQALAAELGGKGYISVSGLARGIDTAAHRATLDSGTIAVFAGGVDIIYPTENNQLAVDLLTQNNLILSESPMGMAPRSRHFPARNRIISGLAQAVVVVEAAAKSGSLITARNALDQGREVLAVPGHPFDARAAGCNMLIRDGARLIRNAQDVIEALTPLAAPPQAPQEPQPQPTHASRPTVAAAAEPPKHTLRDTAKLHREILNRLGPSPVAEDQLIRDLGVSAARVAAILVDLELDGQLRRQAGGLLALRIPAK